MPEFGIAAQISDYRCSIQRHDIYSFRPLQMRAFDPLRSTATAGFPYRALDLLLAPGTQVVAEASPMKDCEAAPKVAADPILGRLNLASAHYAQVHWLASFPVPSCFRPGRACFLFTPPDFWGPTVSPDLRVARDCEPPDAQPASVTERSGPQGWPRLQRTDCAPHFAQASGNGRLTRRAATRCCRTVHSGAACSADGLCCTEGLGCSSLHIV